VRNLSDPIVDLLHAVAKRLEKWKEELTFDHVLTNGKIERELKFLMAAEWESASERKGLRACLFEKEFSGVPLDFVALQKESINAGTGKPQFWIETKCDFAEHSISGDIAKKTLDQVGRYFEQIVNYGEPTVIQNDDSGDDEPTFHSRLAGCDAYIVHFINKIPTKEDRIFPTFVMDKFNKPKKKKADLTQEKLINAYKTASDVFESKSFGRNGKKFQRAIGMKSRLVCEDARHVEISPTPSVVAVIVKLKRCHVETNMRVPHGAFNTDRGKKTPAGTNSSSLVTSKSDLTTPASTISLRHPSPETKARFQPLADKVAYPPVTGKG